MKKYRLLSIVCLAATVVLLSNCNYRPMVGNPFQQELLMQGPENASNKYRQGWRDGCETGISVTANNFQKMFYHFKQDYKLAQNREYYTGWKNSYTYCQRYVAQYLRRRVF